MCRAFLLIKGVGLWSAYHNITRIPDRRKCISFYLMLQHIKLKAGPYVLKMTQINKNLLEKNFFMDYL
jgi:hypothetical protein